jgi:hypothetical protein
MAETRIKTLISSKLWTLTGMFFHPVAAIMFGFVSFRVPYREHMVWIAFPIVTMVLLAYIWFFWRRVVTAWCDEAGLVLSCWFRLITVPWEQVESIRPIPWIRGKPYSVKLRKETSLGDRFFIIAPLSSTKRERMLELFPERLRAGAQDVDLFQS